MSPLLRQLLNKVGLQAKEPSPSEVLEAHISALLERVGESAFNKGHSDKVHLNVVTAAPEYVLKVEAGLSQLHLFAAPDARVTLRIPGDSFFSASVQNLERERVRSLLSSRGLERRKASAHFEAEFSAQDRAQRRQIAQHVETLLKELLGLAEDGAYAVSIERLVPLDNQELLESIRKLAKTREFEDRRVVYQNIINGWFYLPIRSEEDTLDFPEVHAWPHEFHNRPVWAAFTDLEALRDFRHEPEPYIKISGIRLVQAAVAEGLGALKINPRSRVGGELYAHELDTLAEYLQKIGV